MKKSVIIMNFDEESKAFQAFSELKTLNVDRKIVIEHMGVIQHKDSRLKVKDFIDFTGEDKSINGSLIGMLVGLLAGPFGMLIGWVTGGIIGSSRDIKEIENAQSIFKATIDTIPDGSMGVIAIASEYAEEVVDKLVITNLNGNVTRLDEDMVSEEIEEARKLEKDLKKDAKSKWFGRKKKDEEV